jgi:hypothetical protein
MLSSLEHSLFKLRRGHSDSFGLRCVILPHGSTSTPCSRQTTRAKSAFFITSVVTTPTGALYVHTHVFELEWYYLLPTLVWQTPAREGLHVQGLLLSPKVFILPSIPNMAE